MTINDLVSYAVDNGLSLDAEVYISDYSRFGGVHLSNGEKASPVIVHEKTEASFISGYSKDVMYLGIKENE